MLTRTVSALLLPALGVFGLLAIGANGARSEEPIITLKSLLRELIDRDALARYPSPQFACKQWSSYNRESVAVEKPGWFADGDCGFFLRTEQNSGRKEWVLLDHDGPGCVTRIWTPFFHEDFNRRVGPTIRFYLDGSEIPVIEEEMLRLIMGKSFVRPPLAYESVRAGDLYLPLPFAKGCKITTDAKPFYYVINCRAYAPGTRVRSFTREGFTAAAAAIEQVGQALSKPRDAQGGKMVSEAGSIPPGGELAVPLPNGPAAVRMLQVHLPPDQPAALRNTVLKITFDGEQTVWCPVGDLFCSSVRVNAFEDWTRTVTKDGTMTCRWVMPYTKSANVALLNLSKKPVAARIMLAVGDWQWGNRSMLFHANWRQQGEIPTAPIIDWNYVTIQGRGVYVGDALTVYNPVAGWWGEGDEKIYIDNAKFPSHFGTGTEDYYGYAGGVIPDVATDIYTRPFHGQLQVACKEPGYNVLTRIRSLDAIPFQQQLKFDMEVSHSPDLRKPTIKVMYAVATVWYARPGATCNRAPSPEQAGSVLPALK